MKFLTELNEKVEYLTEANDSGEKNYYIEGIFLQADTKNKNGRIYPASVLENEIGKYNLSHIQDKRAYGELNHPTEPTINMDKVSHVITSLKNEGKNYVGKAKILKEMPMGKIVTVYMNEGLRFGVSSRGLGSLKEQNGNKIVEALILTTAADIVADPSVADAMPRSIMEQHLVENYEWFLENETWVKREVKREIIQEEVKQYKTFTREQREEQFLKIWNNFVNTLKE